MPKPWKVLERNEREDGLWRVPVGWVKVHDDFDVDSETYVHWIIAPVTILIHWWSRHRWVIERWLRWRVADLPGGNHCRYWFLVRRPIKLWTLRRTRPHTRSPEYARVEEAFKAALIAYQEAERDGVMSAVRNYIHNV